MAIRGIVVLKLTGDAEEAKDVMRRLASYTGLHFGDRMIFDPSIDEASKRVLWVNTAADEDAVSNGNTTWARPQDFGPRSPP